MNTFLLLLVNVSNGFQLPYHQRHHKLSPMPFSLEYYLPLSLSHSIAYRKLLIYSLLWAVEYRLGSGI
jgi:hypothetical protein